MANYSVLKAAVQAVVRTNGNEEITGANLQTTLLAVIDSLGTSYQFAGVATPSTTPPSSPDYNIAYIGGAGTYANFGSSITVPEGSIGIFRYNGTWTSEQVEVFAGIDNTPAAVGKLTSQTKLDINYIDNCYVNNEGELVQQTPTSSAHYVSLYKLPVDEFQRIELAFVKAEGNSRLILYDAAGDISYNSTCSGSPYVIDNSAGSYHYMSVGTNIIPNIMEITVTPFGVDNGDNFQSNGVVPVTIPDDLRSDMLLVNNAYSTSVSGYYSVYGLYIKNFTKLCFLPFDGGNSTYKKLWLTSTDGVVTSMNYPSSGCITIDNSAGTYAYISFNARDGRTNLYVGGVSGIGPAVQELQHEISYLSGISKVNTERYINVINPECLIYDTYISTNGTLSPISPTQTNRYYSVLFYPCKEYDHFIVSGNSTTSAYIKLYDAGLNEVGSYQGRDVTVDNSDHTICYTSFTSRSSESGLYLNALADVPVRDAATMDNPMYQIIDLAWTDNKYINSDNELASISQTDTYHYKAVHNYYVKDAIKISWDLFFSGSARVVTLDIDKNIIDTYTVANRVKEIDNSDGSIAFISLSNNFVTNPEPIFKIYRVPLVKEAVESLMNAGDVTYPLSGKNVAVLGDSIMMLMSQGDISGGTVSYVGTDGVTYALSDLTNIGGLLYVTSTLVGGEVVESTIQADIHNSNQEALDAESWIPLKEALNANYIINTGRGGATITGNTITTAYPAYGEQTFNTMPNHCLELKRRVDAGEPVPDIIMMWAGTNDVRKFIVNNNWVEPANFDEIMALDYTTKLLADTNEAMQNKMTFYGALRFCMEYLYRNFPNALVMLFSPIPSVVSPRTFDRERKVGSYIKNMAERYSAIFVDACVEMGITDIFDTETTHKWLSDGLHPNSAGKVLFCNYTAQKLNSLFFNKH